MTTRIAVLQTTNEDHVEGRPGHDAQVTRL